MFKKLIYICLFLLISSQVFAFGVAIQAVLSSSGGSSNAKLLVTSGGKVITTTAVKLVRTPAAENWNKLIITPSGYLVVTPSGYIVKAL
jgi:hypothetical protein